MIATHLPDMLRVGVSIAAGTITPSTILRKLGTYSRKNRLYLAYRELGRGRPHRLPPPVHRQRGAALHHQAATNKSESFNDFGKWLAFGGSGVIAENDLGERRKSRRGRGRRCVEPVRSA
jgi:TnpA family transposase